ncbi:MAG: hypothetical protein WBE76_23410 [Terracidiphilus sp.]
MVEKAYALLRLQLSVLGACLMLLTGVLVRAQEVHIRVLNAHNGKPITNECLNIWMDQWRSGTLVAPTDRDGIIVLHLSENQVAAEPGSTHGCGRNAALGPKPLPNNADNLFVSGNMNVVCQEYRKVAPGGSVAENLPNNRMPSYSLRRILELGITASNSCGEYRVAPKPGELVVFERPLHWWESVRQ